MGVQESDAPPAKPQRLVQANSATLNPGRRRLHGDAPLQDDQALRQHRPEGPGRLGGGLFKLENPGGHLNCVFRGTNSSGKFLRKAVESPAVLSNGAWHVAECARTATGLTLTIDGSVVATAKGSSGAISNPRPITIGGKLACDQVKTTCDYFTGDIDYIRITN